MSVGAIYLLISVAVIVVNATHRRMSAREAARVAARVAARDEASSALERADLFALQGAWQECAELADSAMRATDSARDSRAHALRARACLLLGECEAGAGRNEAAHAWLERAAKERSLHGEGGESAALLAAERLLHAGLADPAATGARERPDADAILAEAGANSAAPPDPARLIRLARLALWRAEGELREGSWPQARAHLEQAVTLGERVPVKTRSDAIGRGLERERLLVALARSRASSAATEIGQVLASLGRDDEAREWLDRAVSTLEGALLSPAIVARARALIVRAMHEPADVVRGSGRRAGFLVSARDTALTCDWPAALGLGARAEIQLGLLRAHDGRPDEARMHFVAAHRRMENVVSPGAAELVAEARLLLAHALEDAGELDDARAEYRRALEAGREDADPDARRLAAVAGCHLHRLLHHADRTDEARALIDPLEALAPTLVLPARTLVAAMVARCRGQQSFRDGDRAAAEETLRNAMKLVESSEGPEAADLARQISFELGNLALTADPALAESHLRHALATPAGSRPAAVEEAERAEIRLRLAHVLLELDRMAEAVTELHRVFERGRDSGRANGRAIAAAAALMLGDHPESAIEIRRGWYESAGRFGRLSGTERGRQVAAAVEQRLRELAE